MGNLSAKIYECFDSSKDFSDEGLEAKKKELLELYPLSENELMGMMSYDEAFHVRFVYNSNSIEGSTLTEPETALVLEGEFVPDRPGRDYFAARGSSDGMAYCKKALNEGRALTEDFIKDVHERTALDCQPSVRGVYRRHAVYIRGSQTVPVGFHEVSLLMKDLIGAYLRSDRPALYKIAVFHVMFEHIHPFADGNGRCGRLLLNYMLEEAGYPPISIKSDAKAEYYQGLEDWQVRNDPTLFLGIMRESIGSELDTRIMIVKEARATAARLV